MPIVEQPGYVDRKLHEFHATRLSNLVLSKIAYAVGIVWVIGVAAIGFVIPNSFEGGYWALRGDLAIGVLFILSGVVLSDVGHLRNVLVAVERRVYDPEDTSMTLELTPCRVEPRTLTTLNRRLDRLQEALTGAQRGWVMSENPRFETGPATLSDPKGGELPMTPETLSWRLRDIEARLLAAETLLRMPKVQSRDADAT